MEEGAKVTVDAMLMRFEGAWPTVDDREAAAEAEGDDPGRECMESASEDFWREATLSVDAVERRRASRAETGRTTPSALSPRREKRGAEACVSQFSSGLRDVDGIVRADTGEPVGVWLLREAFERALGVGELGRDDLGLLLEVAGECAWVGERGEGGESMCGDIDRAGRVLCAHAGTGGTAGTGVAVRELADLDRCRGVTGESRSGEAGSLELEGLELGKVSLERTAPSERLRRFLASASSSTGSSTWAAVVENSARGDRCLPPAGVGGALVALGVPSCEKAIEGPARGEERCGREPRSGDIEVALCLRFAREGRSGMESLWSAGGRRGAERATGEGATSIGLGDGWRMERSNEYRCYQTTRRAGRA